VTALLTAKPALPSRYVQLVSLATRDVLAIQLVGAVLRYVTQIMLARWMKSSEYGIYAYAWAWNAQLVPVALVGLNAALLRFVPEYSTRAEGAHLRGILSGGSHVVAGSGAVLGIIGAAFAVTFAAANITPALLIALLCLPLSALVLFYTDALRALYRARWAFGAQLLRPLGVLVGAFCVLRIGRLNAMSCTVCAVAATALVVAIAALVTWSSIATPITVHSRAFEFRAWLRVGAPIGITTYFSAVVGEIGIIMTGYLLQPRQAGLYSVAAKTAALASFTITAANSLAAPVFASLNAQKKHEEMQRVVTRLAHIQFWPTMLAGISLITAGPFMLGLFGRDFRAAFPAFAILIAGEIAGVSVGPVANLLQMTGNQDQAVYVLGGCAVMTVILSPIFIPLWGITGAAVASSLSFVAWKCIMHYLVVKNLGVNPSIVHALRITRGERAA
jgi:O-antigen/teichoic acid export membrane protein